jgi:hypothetical protein
VVSSCFFFLSLPLDVAANAAVQADVGLQVSAVDSGAWHPFARRSTLLKRKGIPRVRARQSTSMPSAVGASVTGEVSAQALGGLAAPADLLAVAAHDSDAGAPDSDVRGHQSTAPGSSCAPSRASADSSAAAEDAASLIASLSRSGCDCAVAVPAPWLLASRPITSAEATTGATSSCTASGGDDGL